MQLNGVKGGDIVQVDGRLAYVHTKEPGRVRVQYAHGSRAFANVSARNVEAHWSRRGNR